MDAKDRFYAALEGLTDPEAKRKAIGRTFIEVFDTEAHRIQGVSFLGQGTIYPDVIESVSVNGPSVTIKSHHNVGGLPAHMKLNVVEPLRLLFKDEVRRVGKELGLSPSLLGRHPFPGPGLGIRILGDITAEKVALLQKAARKKPLVLSAVAGLGVKEALFALAREIGRKTSAEDELEAEDGKPRGASERAPWRS